MRDYRNLYIGEAEEYVREERADRRGDINDRLNFAKNAMLDKLVGSYL